MTLSTATREDSAPVKLLVIQLARLGDTLQSLMALKAAKQLYPQLEIHFLAREKFAAAARRVPWIENVISMPTDDLLGSFLKKEQTENDALMALAEWVGPVLDDSWDLLMNWSFSESSSYLAAMIPATVKLGYMRADDGSLFCADGWSHYMQAVVQGNVDQNIHLTDILTTQLLTALQIHVGDPVDAGEATVNSKGFFSIRTLHHPFLQMWRESTRKWIAFQLGAGKDEKTWDPERWAELASLILKRHSDWSIVILGGAEDVEREARFKKALGDRATDSARYQSLVGKSDFDLWASVVSRCHWVIAGDTAVVHLASVLGTRVVNLSIGPVKPAETGPYGNGHTVIVPKEKENCTPSLVYGVWSHAVSEAVHQSDRTLMQHFEKLGWEDELLNARVLRSRIRATSDGGGVVYEPMISDSIHVGDWVSNVMGQIARAWFCGWVAPVGHELSRDRIGPELIQSLRQLEESSAVLLKICDEAARSAEELALASSRLKSSRLMALEDKQHLEKIGQKILELDKLIVRMAQAQEPYRPFAQMAQVMMHNLSGKNLVDVGRETAVCYSNLREGVKIFRNWLQYTLKIARPKMVPVEDQSVIPLPT